MIKDFKGEWKVFLHGEVMVLLRLHIGLDQANPIMQQNQHFDELKTANLKPA